MRVMEMRKVYRCCILRANKPVSTYRLKASIEAFVDIIS